MSGLGTTSLASALVPGSVEAAHALALLARRRATIADESSASMHHQREIEDWTGTASDAYAARIGLVVRRWAEICEALQALVEPMQTYARALSAAQGLAQDAIEAWAYASSMPPEGAAPPVFHTFTGGWPVIISDARHRGAAPTSRTEAMHRAEAMLADARADVLAAGETAAAAVRALIEPLRARGEVWVSIGDRLGLPQVSSTQVLSIFSSLEPSALRALLRARPDLLVRLSQTGPESVARWWRDLDPELRGILITEAPGIIGNLGGVSYASRDRANRIVLAQALQDARSSPLDQTDQIAALEALEVASRGRTLASLVLDRPPLAQVAVGDLDRASYVSVIVPGMNTSVERGIQAYVTAAIDMQLEQSYVSRVPTSEIAVLAWLGYHPPNNDAPQEVFGDERAAVGARSLARDLQAFHAIRAGEAEPTVSAIGHSYGTDVVTLALTSVGVDHVVLMGSAGVATAIPDASALQVPHGEVYASQSTKDGWAPIGQYFSGRTDPTDNTFGSRVFSSEAAGAEGSEYQGVASHGPFGRAPRSLSYLDPNTSAQHYAAMITMGRGSEIPEWGNPDQRDEQKLENSDQERFK